MRYLFILSLLISNAVQAQVCFDWGIKPKYKRGENMHNGLAKVRGSQSLGFVSKEGHEVVPIKYSFCKGPSCNRLFLGDHNSYGDYFLYDTRFQKVVTDTFENVSAFSGGIAIVQRRGFFIGIDTMGKQQFLARGNFRYDFFNSLIDGCSVFKTENDYWGAINSQGQVIIKPKYRFISNFSDGVAAFQSGSYWGVIDKEGQVVLAPKYEWMNVFSEDLAVVRQGKRYGFINTTGKKVIPIMYRHAHSFSEGFAAVENDAGLWGFIDENNHYILRPQFAQAFSFHEGLARVENRSGKIGYIDKSGKLVIDYQFEDGRDLSEGMIAVKEGGRWGYIKLLNPPKIKKTKDVIVVEQPKTDVEKLKYGKGIVVSGREIQLEIFDFEKEDGDSISLSFNDEPILKNYLLKNKPVKLKINLQPNQDNKLVLYAHNLGRKPPNTAAVKITDSNGIVQQVEMSSDLQKSDVLYFFKEQADVSGQIDYSISYTNVEDKFKEFVGKMPSQETLVFKGDRLRKDIKNSFFLYDNSLSKSYLCKEEPTGKVAYFGPLNKEVAYKLVDGKFNILDYICRKAIITKSGVETEVYYTTDLPFSYSSFAGIPGVVLQYSEKTRLGTKNVIAKGLFFSEMNDSLFSLEGYELQSKAEKQKQKMKEMRALIEARKKGVEDAKTKLLNKPAPQTVFNFLDDKTKPLSDYLGKVVVLNFWFVECMPCKIEMPMLNSVVDSYKGKDVIFISIARNKKEDVKAFLKKTKFDYLPSVGKEHFDKYGVKTFPSTVIINKEGNVIYFTSGLKKDIEKELGEVIQGALE